VGGVEYFGHLAVVDAVRVVAEGRVGLLVFEGFAFAFAASTAFPAGAGRSEGCGGVNVKIPGRRGELVPRRGVVE